MPRPPLPPDDEVSRLVPADARGRLTDLRHPEAVDVWHGVVWSRLGRGDLAWAWWDGVEAATLQPWIDAERGRVCRELGLHTRAQAYDVRALEHATDLVDAVMARLGLVADAVGQRQAVVVPLRATAARSLLATLPNSPRVARQRLRASWVAVEVAFLLGEEPPTATLPVWRDGRAVLGADYRHGTEFHQAKGLLFAGIARSDDRLLEAARSLAPPVLRWAVELACADRGHDGALAAAADAWAEIVPPPGLDGEVAATATARRLTRVRRPA